MHTAEQPVTLQAVSQHFHSIRKESGYVKSNGLVGLPEGIIGTTVQTPCRGFHMIEWTESLKRGIPEIHQMKFFQENEIMPRLNSVDSVVGQTFSSTSIKNRKRWSNSTIVSCFSYPSVQKFLDQPLRHSSFRTSAMPPMTAACGLRPFSAEQAKPAASIAPRKINSPPAFFCLSMPSAEAESLH